MIYPAPGVRTSISADPQPAASQPASAEPAPHAPAFTAPARRLSSGAPLPLRASVNSVGALPRDVFMYLSQFLERDELLHGLASTSKTDNEAVSRLPDPLLVALFTAQQTLRALLQCHAQQPPGRAEPEDVRIAKAQVERARQRIKAEPATRALWQKSITAQVLWVQQQWHAHPRRQGVAKNVAHMLAKINRPYDAARVLRWSIAEVPGRGPGDPEMRHLLLAKILLQAGDTKQAIEAATAALGLKPSPEGRAEIVVCMAQALLLKANTEGVKPEAALAMLQDAAAAPAFVLLPVRAMVQHALGNQAEFRAELETLIRDFPGEAAAICEVYAFTGEAGLAVEWLEEVIQSKDEIGLACLPHSPFISRKVHADPRWRIDLKRLHRAPEQLSKIQFEIELPVRRAQGKASSGVA